MEQQRTIQSTVKNILMVSVITFIIFTILLIIHYNVVAFIPYLPTQVTETQVVPTSYLTKSLFTSSTGINRSPIGGAKLDLIGNTIPLEQFKTIGFTFSFDFFVNGTYKSIDVPRVLFYFGNQPVTINNNSELKEYIGSATETPKLLQTTETNLISKFSNTNFIVYMDPVKNDLKIALITVDKIDTTKIYLEIAGIIKNIPINKSNQITIVLTSNFIEIYKNKELYTTYNIGSLVPRTGNTIPVALKNVITTDTNFGMYSPINFIGSTVKVANIQYYNGILTSSQIRNLINPVSSDIMFS